MSDSAYFANSADSANSDDSDDSVDNKSSVIGLARGREASDRKFFLSIDVLCQQHLPEQVLDVYLGKWERGKEQQQEGEHGL